MCEFRAVKAKILRETQDHGKLSETSKEEHQTRRQETGEENYAVEGEIPHAREVPHTPPD
jgi:hypothetical protein